MTGTLDLPPFYSAIALREHGDAFTHAQAIAADQGAGTLVWVRRFDTVEFAVVLEPDEELKNARRVLYAGMTAIGDALAAHCPPEKPLVFAWPDTILLDDGILGGGRIGWPKGAAETATPDWLVLGFVLRMTVPQKRASDGALLGPSVAHLPNRESSAGPSVAPLRNRAGGHALDVDLTRGTSLEIEGFEMMDAAQVINGFTRHFMVQVDRWQEKGFRGIGEDFLARLPADNAIRRGIDIDGDLLVRRFKAGAEPERQSLIEALRTAQWLDPETGDPWL